MRGSSTVFQTVGKGSASTKARHGMVPVMNIDHTPVECQLQDFYAGDWVDHLDELKVNIDERQVLANAGAFALGRKTDEMIITALDQATHTAGSGVDGLTKAKVLLVTDAAGIPVRGTWTMRGQGRISGQLQAIAIDLDLTFSKIGEPLTIKEP